MGNLVINAYNKKSAINKNIYGHFAEHLGRCIYNGIFVGEGSPIPNTKGVRDDVAAALRRIGTPVLRWPGGCVADEYHWKDGVGALAQRKRMVNTHWGGVVEDNSFGTHEFFELCRQIGCEPYVCGNVGSGTVQEMQEWVEYMTFGGASPMSAMRESNGQKAPWRLAYFGVGNENWGCGGNMTAERYAGEYRRYQTYVRNFGENKTYKIACGGSVSWNETMMREAASCMDGLSIHHYSGAGGRACDFDEEGWYELLWSGAKIDDAIKDSKGMMRRYDPKGKVSLIVDEWGAWHVVEEGTNPGFLYQQNTIRDAVLAGMTLNIFNSHSDRVAMANIAQTVNVLQAVILTEGEKMLLTPTYHVFGMYKDHQGATLVDSFVETEEIGGEKKVRNLYESASVKDDGALTLTLVNTSHERSYEIAATIVGHAAAKASAEILHGEMAAHNTFERPEDVKPADYTPEVRAVPGGLRFAIPPRSVLKISVPA
ncbi:MAG: alpha-N-arabinofuranosidase [Clostridiales bacterium]|jgi:alpha-N-arabinofuranosidase|nr:alpha-N-arabinofuranosidase [Clostridiales bacterium]